MGKRRKLSILVIEGDRDYEKTHNVVPVNWQAFNVIETFMHFLPKMDLDGSSKLSILFRKKKDTEQQYTQSDYFGVSIYYVDEAEIDRQRGLKKGEEEEYYLNIIVNTIKWIARTQGSDATIMNIIDETARKVRDNHFELTLPIKKLARSSADGQFRASVYRHISHQGESWYVEIKDKNKNISRHNIDLLGKPSFVSQTGVFSQSEWEENRFVIKEKFGRVTATIDMSNYIT